MSVIMNKENPWTLKPWHVRASFRKCGIVVPEEAIELPPQPIKGPDMNIQEQAFYVIITVTIPYLCFMSLGRDETVRYSIIHHLRSDV